MKMRNKQLQLMGHRWVELRCKLVHTKLIWLCNSAIQFLLRSHTIYIRQIATLQQKETSNGTARFITVTDFRAIVWSTNNRAMSHLFCQSQSAVTLSVTLRHSLIQGDCVTWWWYRIFKQQVCTIVRHVTRTGKANGSSSSSSSSCTRQRPAFL